MEIKIECVECRHCSSPTMYYCVSHKDTKDDIYMVPCGHCNKIRVYKIKQTSNPKEDYCKFIKYILDTDAEYVIWKLK